MTREAFMEEFVRCTKNEGVIDLPDEILEGRKELLFVIHRDLLSRLTVSELNEAYIFLAGLLLGKYPKIAFIVPSYDRVRLPYAVLDKIPQTKGRLTNRKKLMFAFFVFYSVCIEIYYEQTDEIHRGIRCITSMARAAELLNEDMSRHPERYTFLDELTDEKVSAPFGTSIDNPIKAVNIADGYAYLNSLMTAKGLPIIYDRRGSIRGRNGGIIDCYVITYMDGGTLRRTELYIDPYALENSSDAPEGFILCSNHVDEELDDLIKSAELGDDGALNELGIRYENGQGVRRDIVKAVKCYRSAAKKGNRDATEALQRLGK